MASSYENLESRFEYFFRIKCAGSSNYRGSVFFPLRGVVLNFCNLDFDIVSDLELLISDFAFLGIFTLVENPLQINPFYAKQTVTSRPTKIKQILSEKIRNT